MRTFSKRELGMHLVVAVDPSERMMHFLTELDSWGTTDDVALFAGESEAIYKATVVQHPEGWSPHVMTVDRFIDRYRYPFRSQMVRG